jgi:MFS family permease
VPSPTALIPTAYRALLVERRTRRLLGAMGVSSLGDGMSAVTVAWLAIQVGPARHVGVYVGLAMAAYTLPGVVGALAFAPLLRRRNARSLVLANCMLRAGFLGAIGLLWALGALSQAGYLGLLAGSSVMAAWGNAGKYTLLAELGGESGRLAANSLASTQEFLAVIIGPSLAGLLLAPIGPGALIALDAASFAFLGGQAWRVPLATPDRPAEPIDREAAESGLRLLRRPDLLRLIVLTWAFFFLYGPVEDALPVYVARDLHASASLLGAYWSAFGVGALAATLITGTLRNHDIRRTTLLIVAGWGACLVPFGFAPVGVTLVCFAVGGLVYGPFVPLSYALFQAATTPDRLASVLAARSAVVMTATPLGTALGGPIVGAVGASRTLALSGAATVALAGVGAITRPTRSRNSGPPGTAEGCSIE